MASHTPPFSPLSDEEVEELRQQCLAEMYDKWGAKDRPRAEIEAELVNRFDNPDGFHEAYDRTHVLYETFESYVAEHPSILRRQDLYRAARDIADRLAHFYQLVACDDVALGEEEDDGMRHPSAG